jgi:hypothetical protein
MKNLMGFVIRAFFIWLALLIVVSVLAVKLLGDANGGFLITILMIITLFALLVFLDIRVRWAKYIFSPVFSLILIAAFYPGFDMNHPPVVLSIAAMIAVPILILMSRRAFIKKYPQFE